MKQAKGSCTAEARKGSGIYLCAPGGQQGQCRVPGWTLGSLGLAVLPVLSAAWGWGRGWWWADGYLSSFGEEQAEPLPRLPFYPWEPALPTVVPSGVPGLEGGTPERALRFQGLWVLNRVWSPE